MPVSNSVRVTQAGSPLTPEEKAAGTHAKLAMRVWSDCINDLHMLGRGVEAAYGDAITLLLQAAIAHDATAATAAMVMSRASVESAAHMALTVRREANGSFRFTPLRNRAGKVRRMLQQDLRAGLVRQKLLDESLLLAWGRIEEDGNWIAHPSEIRARIHDEGRLNEETLKAQLLQAGSNSDDRALADIRDAAAIILAVATKSVR